MRNLAKKALYFLLFFIAFSIVMNSIYLLVIARTDWNFAKRIESLRWDNPDFEAVVLGTSLADYGVDAQLLTDNGLKSFNLALVGGSMRTNYIQLEEYVSKYEKAPKYVLFFINSYLEDFGEVTIQPLVEFTMKGQKIDLKDVPISKFQWQTHELLKKAFSSEYRSGYTACGQTRRKRVTADNSEYQDILLDIEEVESAKYIGEMAKLCTQHGIRFIVFEIPGVKETQNLSEIGPYTLSFKNGASAELYNFNSQEFCKFIDSQEDWSGLSHFNERGAAKFSQELLRFISH